MTIIWTLVIAALAYSHWRGRGAAARAPTQAQRGGVGTPRYRYTGMLLLVGIPGSGKTVKLVNIMVQRLAEGRHVRTNFNVNYMRTYTALRVKYKFDHDKASQALSRISYLDEFEDYIDAYDCDVFIDEAQDVLNSGDWNIFPHEIVTWFAQHRHRRCRIVLASHKFGSIHNYVRELIATIQLSRPAPWFIKPFYFAARGNTLPLLQYIDIKDPDEEATNNPRAKKKGFAAMMALNFMPLDPLIANCYDTHGGVRPSPLDKLRKARSKHDLQLTLKPRSQVKIYSWPVDGLPALTPDERVRASGVPGGPGRLLSERWSS